MLKLTIVLCLSTTFSSMKGLYLKTYNKRKELTTEQRFGMPGHYLNDLLISEERNSIHACSLFLSVLVHLHVHAHIVFFLVMILIAYYSHIPLCFIYNAQGSWLLSKFDFFLLLISSTYCFYCVA